MTNGVVDFNALSNEELIVLAKGSDDEEAKEFFFERNKRFVYHEAQKFLNTGLELDELVGVGMVGLVKAYNHYNIERGYKFITLASRIIVNEILMELRKNRRHQGLASMNDVVHVDFDSNELHLEDIVSDTRINVEEEAVASSNGQILEHVLSALSERDKDIVLMHMGGKAQDDIAEQYGISQSYISRIIKRSILKMQKAYQRSLA
jgi:RNA polymerase sporulation-specific sigma factor